VEFVVDGRKLLVGYFQEVGHSFRLHLFDGESRQQNSVDPIGRVLVLVELSEILDDMWIVKGLVVADGVVVVGP
jgi:hypothetical protein